MKKGFTMIELIFVIVIIGILSGVVAFKMNFGRNDAEITNARVQLASIKAGIMNTYNDNLLKGEASYPENLGKDGNRLFTNVLPLASIKEGTNKKGWTKPDANQEKYIFSISGRQASFKYNKNDGSLACSGDTQLCSDLE